MKLAVVTSLKNGLPVRVLQSRFHKGLFLNSAEIQASFAKFK